MPLHIILIAPHEYGCPRDRAFTHSRRPAAGQLYECPVKQVESLEQFWRIHNILGDGTPLSNHGLYDRGLVYTSVIKLVQQDLY